MGFAQPSRVRCSIQGCSKIPVGEFHRGHQPFVQDSNIVVLLQNRHQSAQHYLALDFGRFFHFDYLESAPWNLKSFAASPRFIGVGTILIAEAIRLSLEMGLSGRVGLHSLSQAETFYAARCRMTKVGPDPHHFDLTYFEYTGQQATDWLASIGESP